MRILVRYGEIGVKSSQVRRRFEQRLMDRLEEKLQYKDFEGAVVQEEGRIFAEVDEGAAADAAITLAQTPGVVSVSPVITASLALDDIATAAVDMLEGTEADTFAVDARRAGDHAYTSKDIEEHVGSAVEDAHGLAVDLEEPDVTVTVEARYTQAYLAATTVDGIGGLPVNRAARVAVPMTDRAATVAAFLLMKRGCTVHPVATNAAEAVEHEVELLRVFDPEIKITVHEDDPDTALATVCDLYNCAAAAVPDTSDDIRGDPGDIGVELLHPNAGMTEEEVLQRYSQLQTPPDL